MSFSILCVHCKALLKSPKPVRAGKTVTCPNCKQPFTTPDEGRVTKADPTTALDTRPLDEQAPAPAPAASGGLFGDDMDAAIAKLEAEQSGGKKPASAPASPAAPAPPPVPASAASSDDDEMAAAIAKLEAEQSGGKKPTLAPTTAAAPSPLPVRTASSDDDEMNAAIAKLEAAQSAGKAPAPPPPKKSIPKLEIPDAADDLVLPEHRAEPRAKKKRRDEEDDEPRAKKKRRDEEEDEVDDEPRAKKKRRDEDEDEVDDEPPAKKKRRDEEEVDEHEVDEDDEPRSAGKKTKQKSGSSMLVILLGGGLLVLLGCCGCGVGGYFLFGAGFGPPDVVGRWENDPNVLKARNKLEFRPDGTGELVVLGGKQWFKYEMKGDEMTWTYTHVDDGRGVKVPIPDLPQRKRVQRIGNTLRITNLDGELEGQVGVYFKVD